MTEQSKDMKLKVFIKKVLNGLYYIYGETDRSFEEVEGIIDEDGYLYLTFWKDSILIQYKIHYEFDKSREWYVFIVRTSKDTFEGIIIDRELANKLIDNAEIKFEDLKPFRIKNVEVYEND